MVSRDEAKKFLTSLANLLEEDPAAVRKFLEKFGEYLPKSERFLVGEIPTGKRSNPYFPMPKMLGQIREAIRLMWSEKDKRTRDWRLYRLRFMSKATDNISFAFPEAFATTLPPPTKFEESLERFAQFADLARCCANVECSSRYFFAKRSSQKYCDEKCAEPAQKEFKKVWWERNGKEWRERRKRKLKAKAPRKLQVRSRTPARGAETKIVKEDVDENPVAKEV